MNTRITCSMRLAQALMTMTLALLLAAPVPAALAQNQLWLTQFGAVESDAAFALAPDGEGGVMVAGFTWGNMGGPNAGGFDAFMARYDGASNRLWVRQFGTSESERALALAPDGAGGAMVTGWTLGSLGGANAGAKDAFLARYDNAGNQLWLTQFGAVESDAASALAPDGEGGVMVAGFTYGSLSGSNAGSSDAFLARYDGAGNRLWIRQFGTGEWEQADALAMDGAGGVFVAGTTTGSLGGPHTGSYDAFVARYDGAGNRLWLRQFGTRGGERAYALAPDGAGGVMVAGKAGPNLAGPTSGVGGVFLARYDSEGNELWIRQFGGSSSDLARALVPDGAGGVMVAGGTYGSLGGPNAGTWDIFLARYDGAGYQLWLRQFGTRSVDLASALAHDGAGDVMIAGRTDGSLGRPNTAGFSDAFLARYTIDSCYADCDQSTGAGVLDMLDFLCWQEDFMAGNSYACDCDTSTGQLVCDIFDFLCFQNAFVGGCP